MGKIMMMPKLDMSMQEGIIMDWLVDIGDEVKKGDIVVEIETGKVSLEVDNTVTNGFILAFYAEMGENIKVNMPIMYIGTKDEVPPTKSEAMGMCGMKDEVKVDKKIKEKKAELIVDFDYDIGILGSRLAAYTMAKRAIVNGSSVILFADEDTNDTDMEANISIPSSYKNEISLLKDVKDEIEKMDNKNFFICEKGSIVGENRILSTGKEYRVEKIIIVEEAVPNQLEFNTDYSIPIYNTKTVFSMERLPEKVAIVGGGVSGVQMAMSFCNQGVNAVIIEKSDRVLPTQDKDIGAYVRNMLINSGINKRTNSYIEKVSNGRIYLSDSVMDKCDAIVICSGNSVKRKKYGELEFKRTYNGYIETDGKMKTEYEGIYVVGEVNEKAENIIRKSRALINYLLNKDFDMETSAPYCYFKDLSVGWVGLSEKRIINKAIPYKVYVHRYSIKNNKQAEYFVKVLVDKRWDEILGVHVAGGNIETILKQAANVIYEEIDGRGLYLQDGIEDNFKKALHGIYN